MRTTLLAVLLAVAMVTAGCNGLTSGDQPSATPAGLPPGVSEDGVENVSALLAAQGAALNETGYVATAGSNTTFVTNGTEIAGERTHSRTAYEAGGAEVHERWVIDRRSREPRTRMTWANDTVALSNTVTGEVGSPDARSRFAPADDPDPRIPTSVLADGLTLFRLAEFDVNASGDRVVLTAAGPNMTAVRQAYGPNASVEALSLRVVVDRQGRIRSLDGRMVVRPGERSDIIAEEVVFDARYDLEQIGDVDAERPDWVARADAQIPSFDASLALVDGRYVKLTNEGPQTIPAGAGVGLSTGDAGALTVLSEPLEPGESLYVYRSADGTEIRTARAQPVDAGMALSGTYTVFVVKDRRTVLFRGQVVVGDEQPPAALGREHNP